jgi:glutamate N-acetyltransferase / amino-acid N-acetyltransferase
VQMRADGGHEAAQAIMTTDTRIKECAVSLEVGGREVRIGAMTKGVGMIYPNMATMLAFIGTDARVSPDFARSALKRAVNRSFNMITVDGDTSTNDSCFLLANGLSDAEVTGEDVERFSAALEAVCVDLARKMAADGEGADKLLTVTVTGAASEADARKAARAVVGSSLLKAAVHGEDPNWGRVFAAVGYSGAQVDPLKAALWIGSVQVARDGVTTGVSKDLARAEMAGDEVSMRVDLGLGSASATAWGCDLTEAYVVENSAYST